MENKDLPMSAPVPAPASTNDYKQKKVLVIALVIIALILLCVGGIVAVIIINNNHNKGVIAIDPIIKACEYNGKTYQDGEKFAAMDGCNTCICNNGGAACSEMACQNDDEDETGDDVTDPNPAGGGTEETLIGKLQVTSSDYFYGTTPYPDSIMSLKAVDLVAMTCFDHYSSFASSALVNEGNEAINDTTINSFVQSIGGVNSISWCKTDSGRYIVEYETCTSQCGGGIGTIAYFGELQNNALVKTTELPNQLGAYFTCDKSLALSKNNEFYMRCGAGDGPSGAVAIYKVFLNQGNYTEMTRVDLGRSN